jgi:hypothetical protein
MSERNAGVLRKPQLSSYIEAGEAWRTMLLTYVEETGSSAMLQQG